MNRERAKELLPIIQAFAEGKKIEMALFDDDGALSGWSDVFFQHGQIIIFTALNQSLNTAHSKMRMNVGRKCKNITLLVGL